jgi:hypothetical protein
MRTWKLVLVGLIFAVAGCEDNRTTPTIPGQGPDDSTSSPDAGVSTPAPDAAMVDNPPQDPPDNGDDLGLACTMEELLPILECAMAECMELPGGFDPNDPGSFDPNDPSGGGDFDLGGMDLGELGVCVGISCFGDILGVSPECAECVASALAGTDDFMEACAGDLGGDLPELPF